MTLLLANRPALKHLAGFLAAAAGFFTLLMLSSRLVGPDVSEPPPVRTPAEIATIEKVRDVDLDYDDPLVLHRQVDYAEGESAAWFPTGEAPILANLVAAGHLPPVAERVGAEPAVMEGVEGYDLYRLQLPWMLSCVEGRVSTRRWEYLHRVVVTRGPEQSLFRPGVAVAVVRDCLAALSALHCEGIVHGDIKPSNIMLKCTGAAKIIDIGSAFEFDAPPAFRTCTPAYSAPEVLEGDVPTPLSDLASLGYVLIELLAGRRLFKEAQHRQELLAAKRELPTRLREFVPREVAVNE